MNSASLGSYFKAKSLKSAWKHFLKMHIDLKVKVEGKQKENKSFGNQTCKLPCLAENILTKL